MLAARGPEVHRAATRTWGTASTVPGSACDDGGIASTAGGPASPAQSNARPSYPRLMYSRHGLVTVGVVARDHLADRPPRGALAGAFGERQWLAVVALIVGTELITLALNVGPSPERGQHLVAALIWCGPIVLLRRWPLPAGLAILLPLVAVAYAMVCLVTGYEGVPQPAALNVNGVSVPAHLDQARLENWITAHPGQAGQAFANVPGPGPGPGPAGGGPVPVPTATVPILSRHIATVYSDYVSDEAGQLNPPVNEMVKIGLWIELDVGVAFLVGLGLGSLLGQRTVPIIILIALEIIVTPILAAHVIPYFLDGQRVVVGIALDQLRPAGLAAGQDAQGGPGRVLFGGRAALGIPPMPTWAMITVIAGWVVGWSGIGAWRMVTRDA